MGKVPIYILMAKWLFDAGGEVIRSLKQNGQRKVDKFFGEDVRTDLDISHWLAALLKSLKRVVHKRKRCVWTFAVIASEFLSVNFRCQAFTISGDYDMSQLPLTPPVDKRQRNRDFARHKKVLGQFFTSPVLASWMVEIATSMLADFHAALAPNCGEGVFLHQMPQHEFETVVGIDVDASVLKVFAQQLNDEKRLHLRCGNALWLLDELSEGFDLVVTNPPFSAKYGQVSEPLLPRCFELGHGRNSEAIESLFLELCRAGATVALPLRDATCYRQSISHLFRSKKLRAVCLQTTGKPR